ncbi:hypothetical protein FACS1894104_3250 [Actinomycetota bacterium]|nr:hypothetical protein FACS1894104_3250 [Actinomycetota bacterium]
MSNKKSQFNDDNLDFDLDSFIESLDGASESSDANKIASEQGAKSDRQSDRKFDPNATMAYQDAGEDLPELPLAGGRGNDEPGNDGSGSGGGIGEPGSGGGSGGSGTGGRGNSRQSKARKAPKKVDNTETRTVHNPLDNSDFAVAGTAYRPLDINSTTYRIRGGGSAQRKSPALNVVLAAVVVIGVIVLGYGLYNIAGMLAGTGGGESIELSTAQTREAIDRRLPLLTNLVDADFDGTQAALAEAGQNLFVNARYIADSPDAGAAGRELISVPNPMTEEQIQGFYEGTYSAYSPNELKELFNGAYVLDMTRGDNGAWDKLKYVNFNATSLEDEMSHIRTLQDLTGDTAVVAAQGTDTRGNKVVQGTKAVGDRIFYWKVAACPFSEIYSAAKLSGTAVYVTCTVATYDFFTGADTIS